MNKEQLIKKIKEIHGKSTQGKWDCPKMETGYRVIQIGMGRLSGSIAYEEDAKAIVFYHNNILELVRIIEELEQLNKDNFGDFIFGESRLAELKRLKIENKKLKKKNDQMIKTYENSIGK